MTESSICDVLSQLFRSMVQWYSRYYNSSSSIINVCRSMDYNEYTAWMNSGTRWMIGHRLSLVEPLVENRHELSCHHRLRRHQSITVQDQNTVHLLQSDLVSFAQFQRLGMRLFWTGSLTSCWLEWLFVRSWMAATVHRSCPSPPLQLRIPKIRAQVLHRPAW